MERSFKEVGTSEGWIFYPRIRFHFFISEIKIWLLFVLSFSSKTSSNWCKRIAQINSQQSLSKTYAAPQHIDFFVYNVLEVAAHSRSQFGQMLLCTTHNANQQWECDSSSCAVWVPPDRQSHGAPERIQVVNESGKTYLQICPEALFWCRDLHG